MVLRLTADDEGRTRLVNQDRIHLIHDGIVEPALDPVSHLVDHVVAQVVKTELVVGAVRDVGPVSRLLFLARHLGQVDAHRKTQEVVELAHPLRVTVGKVVVDRNHVYASSGKCVQVNRQGGGQGLALARTHL